MLRTACVAVAALLVAATAGLVSSGDGAAVRLVQSWHHFQVDTSVPLTTRFILQLIETAHAISDTAGHHSPCLQGTSTQALLSHCSSAAFLQTPPVTPANSTAVSAAKLQAAR